MWARLINAALGIWLLAAPDVLGYNDPARTNDQIVGPLVATFAVIAIWEVMRGLRWINLPLGIWMILAPWVLGYDATLPILQSVISGMLIAVMAGVRGSITHTFGGGWPGIWRADHAERQREQSGL